MDKSHIIALFIGSVLTLLGAIFANIFSERRDRRKEFNQAAADFKAAFENELTRLRYEDSTVADIINPALIKHKNAIDRFTQFLGGEDKIRFMVVCSKYLPDRPHPGDAPKYPEYQYKDWFLVEENKARQTVLCEINTILSFAEFK
jgi:hypothetical protein